MKDQKSRLVISKLEGGRRILSHHPDACKDTGPCCIHSPSNHHLRSWRQHYRFDRDIMERLCSHGVGHPDPDDLKVRTGSWAEGVHGCDGCCHRPDHVE